MKKYEIETRELKRLITDSWMNEKSEYCNQSEEEHQQAQQMLNELNKIATFNGTPQECRKMVNADAFLPVHAWIFHFTHMQDLERSLAMNECEEFIRLTVRGVTVATIDIDL
jgi:hypothetical protein